MITKKLAAPKLWHYGEKSKKFVITPLPGPHKKNECLALGIIIRDIFHYAETLKEVKEILNKGVVKVNGKIRKNYKFPIGIMDIVEFGNKKYIVLPDKTRFKFVKTDKNERIVKITNKKYVKHAKLQLNLFDGSNILVDNEKYKPMDSIVLDFNNNIKKHFIFEQGARVMIINGKNIGKIGIVKERKIMRSSKPNIVVIDINGEIVEVVEDYVFVIGDYI